MPARRMNHHFRGLVDRDKFGVLVQHFERYVLRAWPPLRQIRQRDPHLHSSANLISGLGLQAIRLDAPSVQYFLEQIPAVLRILPGKESINPPTCELLINDNFNRL